MVGNGGLSRHRDGRFRNEKFGIGGLLTANSEHPQRRYAVKPKEYAPGLSVIFLNPIDIPFMSEMLSIEMPDHDCQISSRQRNSQYQS